MTRDELIGQAVIALDELLCRDDIADIRDALCEVIPTGFADQCRAAATDTTRGMKDLAATLDGTFHSDVPTGTVPAWIRLGLLTTLAQWTAGHGSTCLHAPSPDRPVPVHAAAWRPDLVVCSQCQHLLHLRPGSAADRRCDGCGTVTTGVENNDPIYPSAVQIAQLSYAYGVCGDCVHWERK